MGLQIKKIGFYQKKEYNSGRNLVEFEANLLIKYAKEGKNLRFKYLGKRGSV